MSVFISFVCAYLGAVLFVIAAVWLLRARNVARRLLDRALDALPPADVMERRRPQLRLFLMRPGRMSQRRWVMPKVSLFDPKSHIVEAVAVLDALTNVDLGWNVLKHGGTLATDYVQRISIEILRLSEPLRSGMERIAHLSTNSEAFLQAILPTGLWNWFNESQIMRFAHAVEAKVRALDGGEHIEFQPDGSAADIDFSFHFPWITALLSTAREVRLLTRNDTTPGRALAHITLDVVAVSTGAYVAASSGAVVLAGLAVVLDLTLTAGVVSAVLGLFGVGGAVAGAKVAGVLKGVRLEELSEQYARQSVDVARRLEDIERRGRQELEHLAHRFDERSAALRATAQASWRSELKHWISRRNSTLRAFSIDCQRLLRSHLAAVHERMAELRALYMRRRWLIWWPTVANVSLWVELRFLKRTAASLERARRELDRGSPLPFNEVWRALRTAVTQDPMLVLAPDLARWADQDREFVQRISAADTRHRTMAEARFTELQKQLEYETTQVLRALDSEATPVLKAFRELEQEVQREAAALGKRPRAA